MEKPSPGPKDAGSLVMRQSNVSERLEKKVHKSEGEKRMKLLLQMWFIFKANQFKGKEINQTQRRRQVGKERK